MVLAEELNKKFEEISGELEKIKQRLESLSRLKKAESDIANISSDLQTFVDKSTFNKELQLLSSEIEKKDVRKIDLGKLESKFVKLRTEFEKFEDTYDLIEKLKENLVSLKRKSLTSLSFVKYEKWLAEVEAELKELISIGQSIDNLRNSAYRKFNETDSRLRKLEKQQKKIKKKDYKEFRRVEDILSGQVYNIAEKLDLFEKRLKLLEKQAKEKPKIVKVVVKERPKQKTKKSKKAKKSRVKGFFNWLLEKD
ncbi:hypothetical protein KY311_01205 [Candidatus Woesearchaeota archaeon]|nr:hypothetical protein [Candidatus Woesearchaeota archaeon]MBW3016987.1 hypothetical protein [Candidatus Woesearchaeota archaeon]